jgi:hypothetical protein
VTKEMTLPMYDIFRSRLSFWLEGLFEGKRWGGRGNCREEMLAF